MFTSRRLLIASALLFLIKFNVCLSKDNIVGCYYTNWAQYRQDRAKFSPENYQPGLCTHIFYAFAVMNDAFSVIPFEWNDESTSWSKGMYERVNDLKNAQPSLKTLLSFGGWIFSQNNKPLFKSMINSQANRKTFLSSALALTKKYKFDGFDMDWEYPDAEDKSNFALLLEEMSSIFHSNGLLVSAAVAAGKSKIEPGYDIPSIARSLDFVNIMTYDMHGGWEAETGLNSPLYDRNGDGLSVSNAVQTWVDGGLPKSKVIVGFPTYGRSWTLTDPSRTVVGSAGTQAPAGPFTREAGFFAYYEIEDLLTSGGRSTFDDAQKCPYMVKGSLWVGYDDVKSYNVKLDWLKQGGYGGAFVWSLDLDDFNGQSSQGEKYPLISKISTSLRTGATNNQVRPTRYSPSATKSSAVRTTKRPSEGSVPSFQCSSPGLYSDPNHCSSFYSCGSDLVAHRITCAEGLKFNRALLVCDWARNVHC